MTAIAPELDPLLLLPADCEVKINDIIDEFVGTSHYGTLLSFKKYVVAAFYEYYKDQNLDTTDNKFNILSLLNEFGGWDYHYHLKKAKSPMLVPLIVIFLRVLRTFLPEYGRKYATVEEFLKEYKDIPEFKTIMKADLKEKVSLFYNANWMHVLVLMMRANANKGRFLNIISKLIEGYTFKCTTGGKATLPIQRRSAIYHHESNLILRQRSQEANEPKKRKISMVASSMSTKEPPHKKGIAVCEMDWSGFSTYNEENSRYPSDSPNLLIEVVDDTEEHWLHAKQSCSGSCYHP